MSTETATVETVARHVPANGIDIHYIEAGQGEPLMLLHGGVVSTNPHLGRRAGRVRVLPGHARRALPGDRPGHARRREDRPTGGSISFDLLADDVVGADRRTRARAAAGRRLQRRRDHRDDPRDPHARIGPRARQPRRLRLLQSRSPPATP